MAVRFRSAGAGVLALLAFALTPPARGGNELYNFNASDGGWTVTSESLTPPEKPWTWVEGPSVNEGGWQAWRGADAFQSASYLVSPLLVVDNTDGNYVRMDIRHRFDFGGTGTTPLLALGQVQYQINNGSWLGIRTQDFGTTSGKIAPSYPNPPYPFIDQTLAPPTGTYAVDAWNGTTLNFSTGFHIDSQFELNHQPVGPYTFGPGDFIRFRFLVGTQTPLSGTGSPVIDWEINRVQIDGVNPAVVPEPGTLALAGIGGLCCLLLVRRRRRLQAAQAVAGSMAATIVVGIVIAAGIAAPARGESTSWNFQSGNGGWIATGTWGPFPTDPNYQWKWVTSSTVSGGTSPHWAVRAQGVDPSIPSAAFLTSPTFSTLVSSTAGFVPAQAVRISLAHDFLLLAGTTNGIPTTLGQLEYRLNPVNGNGNGTWFSLPLSYFSNGGSVLVDNPVFGASPFKSGSGTVQLVDQTAFVAPNYQTPNGGNALPYVVPASAAFTGMSPGWPTAYVPSQGFITGTALVPVAGISSMQLRLTNLNLAANCSPTDGWNVRFVQVDYLGEDTPIPPVPEPGALALGATGLAALAAAGVLGHRRHQRPSRPSESP